MKTRYPIFIMSYRRPTTCLTARYLDKHGIDYKIVVEHDDYEDYRMVYSASKLIVEPKEFKGIYGACNFIKSHAAHLKVKFHWQFDDDITGIFQWKDGKHSKMTPYEILTKCEDFADQYTNIGILGLSSNVFSRLAVKAYAVNSYPHTCVLVRSVFEPDIWYRPDVESDVDFVIRLLMSGYCTVKFYMFSFIWTTTESIAGGATETYTKDSGRLNRFKKTLEKWPQIGAIVPKKGGCGWRMTTEKVWRKFKHPLILDPKSRKVTLPVYRPYKTLKPIKQKAK